MNKTALQFLTERDALIAFVRRDLDERPGQNPFNSANIAIVCRMYLNASKRAHPKSFHAKLAKRLSPMNLQTIMSLYIEAVIPVLEKRLRQGAETAKKLLVELLQEEPI